MDKICKHLGELHVAAVEADAGVQHHRRRILNGIPTGSRPAAAGITTVAAAR